MEFYTIGVYNSTEKDFFEKLIHNDIDTFFDIRQRRGVRGAKYSFVNSKKLQFKLNELGIKYYYTQELAPTTEIREKQKEIDQKNSILKKERNKLGNAFIFEYENLIIKKFDFNAFIKFLENNHSKKVVLFCVEEFHEACHRSIVTNTLNKQYNYNIIHL
ncbi:MAG: DUF488 family protein [Bacteroidales bacterium]